MSQYQIDKKEQADESETRPMGCNNTCIPNLPKSSSCKAHSAPNIHWILEYIKRETFDAVIHEDTEVVSEERACDPECIRGSKYKRLADYAKYDGKCDVQIKRGVTWKEWLVGLRRESEMIPGKT